jgi:hypothetical protein
MMSNGKTQRSRRNGSAAVVESTALALPHITRAQANKILKARAVELYQDARSAQQHQQRDFEAQYGRADHRHVFHSSANRPKWTNDAARHGRLLSLNLRRVRRNRQASIVKPWHGVPALHSQM